MPRWQRLFRKAQARPIEFHSMEQSQKTSAKVNKPLWVSWEYMAMGGKNWLRFRLQNTHPSPAVAFSSQMKRRRAMEFMTSKAETAVVATFFITGRGEVGLPLVQPVEGTDSQSTWQGVRTRGCHQKGWQSWEVASRRSAVLGGRKDSLRVNYHWAVCPKNFCPKNFWSKRHEEEEEQAPSE